MCSHIYTLHNCCLIATHCEHRDPFSFKISQVEIILLFLLLVMSGTISQKAVMRCRGPTVMTAQYFDGERYRLLDFSSHIIVYFHLIFIGESSPDVILFVCGGGSTHTSKRHFTHIKRVVDKQKIHTLLSAPLTTVIAAFIYLIHIFFSVFFILVCEH